MSRQNSTIDHDHAPLHQDGTGVAPGKQTLTQGIPSLRGRERNVARFDATSELREDRTTIDGPPTTMRLTNHQLRKARRRNPHWHERLGFSPADFGGGGLASNELAENIAERQAALGLAIDGIAGPKTIAALASASAAGDRAPGGPASSPTAAADDDHELDALFNRTIAEAGGEPEPAEAADDGHELDGLYERAIAEAGGDEPDGGAAAGRTPPAADDPFGMHLLGQRR